MSKKSGIILAHVLLFLVNTFYGANHVIAKGIMPKYIGVSIEYNLYGIVYVFFSSNAIGAKYWNVIKGDVPIMKDLK